MIQGKAPCPIQILRSDQETTLMKKATDQVPGHYLWSCMRYTLISHENECLYWAINSINHTKNYSYN